MPTILADAMIIIGFEYDPRYLQYGWTVVPDSCNLLSVVWIVFDSNYTTLKPS